MSKSSKSVAAAKPTTARVDPAIAKHARRQAAKRTAKLEAKTDKRAAVKRAVKPSDKRAAVKRTVKPEVKTGKAVKASAYQVFESGAVSTVTVVKTGAVIGKFQKSVSSGLYFIPGHGKQFYASPELALKAVCMIYEGEDHSGVETVKPVRAVSASGPRAPRVEGAPRVTFTSLFLAELASTKPGKTFSLEDINAAYKEATGLELKHLTMLNSLNGLKNGTRGMVKAEVEFSYAKGVITRG